MEACSKEIEMILPDVLVAGLKVVFCGTAVGDRSARRGAHYAGPGNRFWDVLAETGLTPSRLRPEEYPTITRYGIGLTDLVKGRSGNDAILSPHDFDTESFKNKILRHAPRAVGFNGKKAAEEFLGKKVEYGQQLEQMGRTAIFALPSTSGRASGFWNATHWHELAGYVAGKQVVSPCEADEREKVVSKNRMRIISRTRILRSSTRRPELPYRVDTEDVAGGDILQLTICHESNPETPIAVFEFRGSDLGGKRSIHFTASKVKGLWEIMFSGVSPSAKHCTEATS